MINILTGEEIIQAIMRFSQLAEIAHHIPGRVRLKFSPMVVQELKKVDPKRIAEKFPGILNLRVNQLALTTVVEYDPEIIEPEIWEDLVSLRYKPERSDYIAGRLRTLWQLNINAERR